MYLKQPINCIMKFPTLLFLSFLISTTLMAQMPNATRIKSKLPAGTLVHENLNYSEDEHPKHLLDLYIPASAMYDIPLLILIHGGGWIGNDKYSDMGYMPETISAVLNQGIAIASIDYRFATEAVFPEILQDCNLAVSYLYDNSKTFHLDTDNFMLIGFSAGGHLASLMGTSQNNQIPDFYIKDTYRPLTYKAVVDFYGPTDLTLLQGNEDEKSPEGILIGSAPILRPDLAKAASPITYIDIDDPPFLIFHGEKDQIVSNKQSKLFHSWLKHQGVNSELMIVKDAPHFGTMYDVSDIRKKVIQFLKERLY